MNILVIGSGGREHALVWKIAQSPKVTKIYCAPGNPGIADLAECIPIAVEDIPALAEFAQKNAIDLTVVGPEVPLTHGIVDYFDTRGLKVFGPSKAAAELEGSKAFAKAIMQKYNIPTANYETFTDRGAAIDYIERQSKPMVVKADGLAAGKGVVVAQNRDEAIVAVSDMMDKKVFGAAGCKVVIEEFLEGEEASLLAFTDGTTLVPMVAAQDHKRVFDNDQGPNTGGMGAYAPAPVVTPDIKQRAYEEILLPMIQAMAKEGRPYKGVLYAGLMITDNGPKVIEFNVRFGDPETQVVLPLLKSDLVDIMLAVAEENLSEQTIEWHDRSAVCVVMASGGYPGNFAKGVPVTGTGEAAKLEDTVVFHAGTALEGITLVTAGGRVFGVTAWGDSIAKAVDKSYQAVDKVHFSRAQYRSDIAWRAMPKE